MAGGLNSKAKQERLTAVVAQDQIVDRKIFNLIMGLVVFYGLLVNIILCYVAGDALDNIHPILFLVVYAVCAIAGTVIANKSDKPIISFLGYNLIVLPVGLLVASAVKVYAEIDPSIVTMAFVETAGITVIMTAASFAFPDFFAKLGRTLFLSLILIIIASLVCVFFFPQGEGVLAWVAAGVFSMYIGYDIHRAQIYPSSVDNAVDCAIDIYLDIINLFLRIMEILARAKSDD